MLQYQQQFVLCNEPWRAASHAGWSCCCSTVLTCIQRVVAVAAGYDYINRGERTSANILADGGYQTAHFGKWHNGRTLGYEPWFMGFQESWFPDLYIQLDNLMRYSSSHPWVFNGLIALVAWPDV